MSSRTPFVGALEGLRGYAALLMVVYHAWVLTAAPLGGGPLRRLVSSGFLAVDVFFILSAFVLFLPVVVRGSFGSRTAYALRRIARIVPAYYVALAVAIVGYGLLAGPVAASRPITLDAVLAHLTFSQIEARLVPGYEGALGFRVNPALWTLSVEAAFYVVLPFVALRYLRRPLTGLALALAAGVALRVLVTTGGVWTALGLDAPSAATEARLLSLPPLFVADFAVGMTGAWLFARGRATADDGVDGGRPWVPPGWALALALPAAVLVAGLAGGSDAGTALSQTRRSLLLAVLVPLSFGAVILAASTATGVWRHFADNPAARWLGKVSYGVFLFHFMVMELCLNTLGFPRGSTAAFLVLLAAALPGTLGLGWLSWRLVESPARRLARRAAARAEDAGRRRLTHAASP